MALLYVFINFKETRENHFTFSFRNNSELFLTLLVISMPVKLACRNTFHDMIASKSAEAHTS